MIISASLFNST